jgi:hypothetical protein
MTSLIYRRWIRKCKECEHEMIMEFRQWSETQAEGEEKNVEVECMNNTNGNTSCNLVGKQTTRCSRCGKKTISGWSALLVEARTWKDKDNKEPL